MSANGSFAIRSLALVKGLVLMGCWVMIGMAPSLLALDEIPGVPDAKKVGQGELKYAIWHVYTATLYAPKGIWQPHQPMALRIQYHLNLDGKKIADRSMHEIKHQSKVHAALFPSWHAQLKKIMPTVKSGTVLSAVFIPGQGTFFYQGTQLLGRVPGDTFGESFFDIWLGPKTSEPVLRKALLSLP